MKKRTCIFKSMIAIVAATIFIACKKETGWSQKDNVGNKVIPAAQAANPSAMTKTKPVIYPVYQMGNPG